MTCVKPTNNSAAYAMAVEVADKLVVKLSESDKNKDGRLTELDGKDFKGGNVVIADLKPGIRQLMYEYALRFDGDKSGDVEGLEFMTMIGDLMIRQDISKVLLATSPSPEANGKTYGNEETISELRVAFGLPKKPTQSLCPAK